MKSRLIAAFPSEKREPTNTTTCDNSMIKINTVVGDKNVLIFEIKFFIAFSNQIKNEGTDRKNV